MLPEDPVSGKGLARFAAEFRDGRIQAAQVTRDYLDRIQQLDAQIGAFAAIAAESALEQAREMDRKRDAGDDVGPLMGVPIAIKQIFRVNELPFGAGTTLDLADLAPAEGPFVRMLKRQGAIILGATRTTEFAFAFINCRTPAPWNPCDSRNKRVCGGSSHGSAAALAAGACALAIGTDTGGSVRLPAALCGVVGYKPTVGTWPTQGIFPVSPTFDTIGLFTRSVADTVFAYSALTGHEIEIGSPSSPLRIGRLSALFDELDAPVAQAMERTLRLLQSRGLEIVDVALPELEETASVLGRLLPLELMSYLGAEKLRQARDRLDPITWARLEPEFETDGDLLIRLRKRHDELTRVVREKTAGFDVLIAPTTPVSPELAAVADSAAAALAWNRRAGRNTRPGNLFRQCGISIPVHEPGELPVGLQLLAPSGMDRRLLAIASIFERLIGESAPPSVLAFANPNRKE